jgi:hypothetical protein
VIPTLGSRLASHQGVSADKLGHVVWENFVDRVISALIEAETLIQTGKAPFNFLSKQGWWRVGTASVRGQPVKVPAENSITDLLVRTLEQIRNAAGTGDLLHRQGILFSQQAPRHTQDRIGSKALTTDIRAVSASLPYLDLRIEAKVLLEGKDVSAYCGKEGLLRFGDVKEPYTDAPVGMMLGYFLRHDGTYWQKAIETKIGPMTSITNASGITFTGKVLLACDLDRAAARTTVLHLTLSFDTDPNARSIDGAAVEAAKRRVKSKARTAGSARLR